MKYLKLNKKRLIFIGLSLVILIFALLQTYYFLGEFKKEEKVKMEILAEAYQKFNEAGTNDNLVLSLSSKIFTSNNTIPVIIMENDSIIKFHRNIKKTDSLSLLQKAREFAAVNKTLQIDLGDGKYWKIYYGNSSLYNKLTYYPLVFIGIFFLFIAVVIQYYRTGKMSDENRLWSGLAKETAHQIGTPLSSLMGWVEILKTQNNPDIPVEEIEKDVQRLNIISQRFSKIGSIPKLQPENISEITQKTLNYFKNRSSKKIQFLFEAPENITANISEELYTWVIENLIKNAIDAMEGEGTVSLKITPQNKHITIDVSDTGKGIPASQFKEIFQPGYTTKKRGWGLGLSLAKRIIEQYHKGKIFVKKSKPGEGSTFRIVLPK